MPSLSSGVSVAGSSGSISALVKSAGSLQYDTQEAEDEYQAQAYATNHDDASTQEYTAYLTGRISQLDAEGTGQAILHAASLQGEVASAQRDNLTFNVSSMSAQILSGNATDQDKLNYLGYAYQTAMTSGDVDQATTFETEAYNLQQSMELEAQTAATASETQAATDLAAQERGFTDGEAALKATWTQMQDAYKNGDSAGLDAAFKTYAAVVAPIYKANGIAQPKNATGDMNTAHLGELIGLAQYYENAAVSVGSSNPDYQTYVNKAIGTLQGSEFRDALTGAMAPSNLTSDSTTIGPNGTPETSQVTNAVSGYKVVTVTIPGLAPVTIPVPISTGNAQTPYGALGKGNQSTLDDKLKGLGLNILSGTSGSATGELKVEISDKAASWLGSSGLQVGERVEAIPTDKGIEFVDSNNNVMGVSFDNTGKIGLFQAGPNNTWRQVGGETGYNPRAPQTAPKTRGITQAISGGAKLADNEDKTARNIPNDIVKDQENAPRNLIHAKEALPGYAAGAVRTQATLLPKAVSGLENFLHVGNTAPPAAKGPQMIQRAGGGYNFIGSNGQAISAATYAQQTHTQFRTLLTNMAAGGDQGAKAALGFVGNDLGYNPNAIGGNGSLYNSLVWGTGKSFTGGAAPSAIKTAPVAGVK